MKKVAVICGTRPEIIKLAPIVRALEASGKLKPIIIATGQHEMMADQAFKVFSIEPEISLRLMLHEQTPSSFLGALLAPLEEALNDEAPVGAIVQGDTATTLGGAMTAFQCKIPVAHVEAGLRTHDLSSPFPEEMNRSVVSRIASIHFCPTQAAKANLEREGISENVMVTGNTVVDALQWVDKQLGAKKLELDPAITESKLEGKKFILVTGHRRENFDKPIRNLCEILKEIATQHEDISIVYPVHLNPNVFDVVFKELKKIPRIHLLPPVSYPGLVHLLKSCQFAITDSGGIQEEAPSFGKRLLVTRRHTERPEAIEAGCAELVDLLEPKKVIEKISSLIRSGSPSLSSTTNPFGDGHAAERIVKALEFSWS